MDVVKLTYFKSWFGYLMVIVAFASGAETLIDDLISGVRSGLEPKTVFERYRKIDTLLIDNLWVLAGRPKTSRVIR